METRGSVFRSSPIIMGKENAENTNLALKVQLPENLY